MWGKRIWDGVGLRNREGFLKGYTGARREERGRLQGREEVLARVQMEQSGGERPGLSARALSPGFAWVPSPWDGPDADPPAPPPGRAGGCRAGRGWRGLLATRRSLLSGPGLRAAAELDPGDGGGK